MAELPWQIGEYLSQVDGRRMSATCSNDLAFSLFSFACSAFLIPALAF